MRYRAESVHYRSNGTNVITKILLKILTPCIPPFKVTQSSEPTQVQSEMVSVHIWNRNLPPHLNCIATDTVGLASK